MMAQLKLLRDAYKPKESEIRADIQKYLDMKGIFNWRSWQGQFSVRGVPDIIGLLPGSGRGLGIEVKLPGWKPPVEGTKQFKHYSEQKAFLDNIKKSGGVAFFACSIDEVESNLQFMRKG